MEIMEQGVRSDLVLAPGLGTTISNLAIAIKTNQPDEYDQESLTRHRRQHLTSRPVPAWPAQLRSDRHIYSGLLIQYPPGSIV